EEVGAFNSFSPCGFGCRTGACQRHTLLPEGLIENGTQTPFEMVQTGHRVRGWRVAFQVPRLALKQPGCLGLVPQIVARTRADLLDDQPGGERTEIAAALEVQALRVTVEEAGGIKVARAGGV